MRVKNFVMWCGVADDSVVVIKTQPVKAGNSVEGKTELLGVFHQGMWFYRKEPMPAKG